MRPRCILCPKTIALLAILVWIGTGCYVPIQQIPPGTREHMPAWRDDIRAGEVSRADVLLTMGEPDEVSAGESVLIYRWQRIDGIIVITQCTQPIELTSETVISFTFDEKGVLQGVEVSYN